ncbi:MAG: glycogen debranching enzyme N-terminal domain-containing protein [Lentisphaerae bacterium]|nr:glycogen debranching enzyme N-terminal domain-containing protein [Lentisphaerota bacterium]
MNTSLQQLPHPGQHRLAFCGDLIEFTLRLSPAQRGRAFLRTNIGQAETARREIISEAIEHQKRLNEDWFDIPMTSVDGSLYRLTLPLLEPGHFEAKALFLPEGASQPQWPEGPNTVINVHPAEYCGANIIYNAFVRQFGQEHRPLPALRPAQAAGIQVLEGGGYAVIPPSGTFRDLKRQLDFIIGRLRCRVIMLLPIHPTPTVYGRMGRFGSPYAALDFMEVDPALAEFDPKTTPLEQFGELVDAVHARGARLFLDIAINHTGWAAKLHSEHPDWLLRESDGTIRSPRAWGVVWCDLTELDHQHVGLCHYLAKVFLTWCRRGVDGFRCDAGYMIPVPAWEFIVATVRREFPDTLFLLEGLGGKMETTTSLLNTANLNWAYSELFQNYDRGQIDAYLPGAIQTSQGDGILVHFAETHDNNRLAARSIPYARMRTALAALCSSHGAFAFANGVEWHATEKIDVHGRSALAWGASENQVDRITRLNCLLQSHTAFFAGASLRLIHQGAGNSIALLRHQPATDHRFLVLANLDDHAPQPVAWNPAEAFPATPAPIDLLTGRTVAISFGDGLARLELAPAEVLCLSPDRNDFETLLAEERAAYACPPDVVRRQRLRAKALEIAKDYRRFAPSGLEKSDFSTVDPDQLARLLAENPEVFCNSQGAPDAAPRVIAWEWPRDLKREVMIPPHHFLYLRASVPFRARIVEREKIAPPVAAESADKKLTSKHEHSLAAADGHHFVMFCPGGVPGQACPAWLELSIFEPERTRHATAPLLFLPAGDSLRVPLGFAHKDLRDANGIVLSTNGRGGMMRAPVKWAEVRSRYDALLAGNLSPDYPEDRCIMLTRCRAWLVYQGYSQDITTDRLQFFQREENSGLWRFRVPFGHGQQVFLDIQTAMIPGRNAVQLTFRRLPSAHAQNTLADERAVQLIIRPDIEDRSFHEVTKAFLGPEQAYPAAVHSDAAGFVFAPDGARQLRLTISCGGFQPEPEWQYMVHYPLEAERGQEAATDLFSPGYFRASLAGGAEAVLLAQILTPAESKPVTPVTNLAPVLPAGGATPAEPLLKVLEQALRQFIVRRGKHKTVIAGYPWFLDWGRDTLICARGLIAAGLLEEVAAILKQFAAFEQAGTLPNMILGEDARNRDSSDAPLWFIIACADACRARSRYAPALRAGRAADHQHLLDQRCGQRTLREVLESIVAGYRQGTPNGIRMDPESGLVFSPAHFTWMDTNHPAGSPRQGYPIEIQALWFAALTFLAGLDNRSGAYQELADQVGGSIRQYYWNESRGYFIDCLHARQGQGAARAVPDDALRPNQLLALTLGAVTDRALAARALAACAQLLVPGAIRTLADCPVEFPQPIMLGDRLLNDPLRPYWGRYAGDEDTRRKPAYHNGTAWTWLFPSFCEAWVQVHGSGGRPAALAWLGSSIVLVDRGCLGQIPEILDGDYPHIPRGCDAQAWGVSELYRVLKSLS